MKRSTIIAVGAFALSLFTVPVGGQAEQADQPDPGARRRETTLRTVIDLDPAMLACFGEVALCLPEGKILVPVEARRAVIYRAGDSHCIAWYNKRGELKCILT